MSDDVAVSVLLSEVDGSVVVPLLDVVSVDEVVGSPDELVVSEVLVVVGSSVVLVVGSLVLFVVLDVLFVVLDVLDVLVVVGSAVVVGKVVVGSDVVVVLDVLVAGLLVVRRALDDSSDELELDDARSGVTTTWSVASDLPPSASSTVKLAVKMPASR